MTETRDERRDLILEVICEMWNPQKLLDYVESEYQRGRNDYRDELLAKMDAAAPTAAPVRRIEFKPSEEKKVEEPKVDVEEPKVAPKRERESYRGSGAARPENIPTTFSMFRTVLTEMPSLVAAELTAEIAKRWWPGLDPNFLKPDISTNISNGRLTRDADGKLNVTAKGEKSVSIDLRERDAGKQPAPKIPAPVPKVHSLSFATDRGAVDLPVKEYQLASRLYAVKGQHIGSGFLAEKIYGVGAKKNADMLLRELTAVTNTKIKEVGLIIAFYDGIGFMIRDVQA